MKRKLIKRSKLVSLAEQTMTGFAKTLEKEYLIDAGGVKTESIFAPLLADRLTREKFGTIPINVVTQDRIEDFITYILHHRWQCYDEVGYFRPEQIAWRKRSGNAEAE